LIDAAPSFTIEETVAIVDRLVIARSGKGRGTR
jgi:hypothetical protein